MSLKLVSNIGKINTFDFNEHGQIVAVDQKAIKVFNSDGKLHDHFPHDHSEKINCISVCGDTLVTGSDDMTVKSWSISAKSFSKTILRSNQPIRLVSVRPPNSRTVAIVSDDLDIKLVNATDVTNIQILKGHSKAILAVSMDPLGDYMLTCGFDGTIFIWDLLHEPSIISKTLDNLIDKNSTFFNVSWNKKKDIFCFPGKAKEIIVMERESWQILYRIKNEKLGDVKRVAWSPDGKYLAALDTKEQLFIWNPEHSRNNFIQRVKCPSAMKLLVWDSTSTSIWTMDTFGSVYRMNMGPNWQESSKSSTSSPKLSKSMNPKEFSIGQNDFDDLFLDEGEEDDVDDFIVDDDGAGYATELLHERQFQKYEERQKKSIASKSRNSYMGDKGYKEVDSVEIQRSFQPGSTPLRNNRRYLAFNLLGIVYCIEQSSYSNISVEFHDRSVRPISFTDNFRYSMGCLDEQGVLFASESTNSSPSVVHYKSLDGIGQKNEWMAQLDLVENVQGIALTSQYVVIATDQRYLRFFSLSGTQKHVISLSGPVVAISGSKSKLMIFYHQGGVYHGDQNMVCAFYNTSNGCDFIEETKVPLSPGSVLDWIGFDDRELAATFDSCGVLRYFISKNWVPILDTRKHRGAKSEVYWPVGLTETHLMCVICKGGDKYPPFPKPLLHEIDFQIPLLNFENPQVALEEKQMQLSLFSQPSKIESIKLRHEAEMDKITLQLIQLACKTDRSQRAFDLSKTLFLSRSLDGAMKLAVHYRLSLLAEMINRIKEERYNFEKKLQEEKMAKSRIILSVDNEEEYNHDVDQLKLQVNASKGSRYDQPYPKNIKENTENTSHSGKASPNSNVKKSDIDSVQSTEENKIEVNTRPTIKSFNQVEKKVGKPKNPFAVSTKDNLVPVETRVGMSLIQAIQEKTAKRDKSEENENAKAMKRKAQSTLGLFSFQPKSKEMKKEDEMQSDN